VAKTAKLMPDYTQLIGILALRHILDDPVGFFVF